MPGMGLLCHLLFGGNVSSPSEWSNSSYLSFSSRLNLCVYFKCIAFFLSIEFYNLSIVGNIIIDKMKLIGAKANKIAIYFLPLTSPLKELPETRAPALYVA